LKFLIVIKNLLQLVLDSIDLLRLFYLSLEPVYWPDPEGCDLISSMLEGLEVQAFARRLAFSLPLAIVFEID
jgi:hypothetical protein